MPPPSGGGYHARLMPPAGVVVKLQLCRPLPGAVTRNGRRRPAGNPGLQLCRPLPGAVTGVAVVIGQSSCWASIVPPPSGGGYESLLASGHLAESGFNCAAPFRGRLPDSTPSNPAGTLGLQLCRPLPGAVTADLLDGMDIARAASIVPPPSGGGYQTGRALMPAGHALQLCRPLPGAVTDRGDAAAGAPYPLQLCRPLPGAVTWPTPCELRSSCSFNCASPFRGRLRRKP